MLKEQDCNPDFMNSLDEWLADENNQQMMHQIKTDIDNIPYLLAVDLCASYLDASGYKVMPKDVKTMEERRLEDREKTLEKRIEELEIFIEDFYYQEHDPIAGELLFKGENYLKCFRCKVVIHDSCKHNKNGEAYCECCIDEI